MSAKTERLLQRALEHQKPALTDLVQLILPWIQVPIARQMLNERLEVSTPDAGELARARRIIEAQTAEMLLYLFSDDGRLLRAWNPDVDPSLQHFIEQQTALWLESTSAARKASESKESKENKKECQISPSRNEYPSQGGKPPLDDVIRGS